MCWCCCVGINNTYKGAEERAVTLLESATLSNRTLR